MAEYTGHLSRRTWFSGMAATVMGSAGMALTAPTAPSVSCKDYVEFTDHNGNSGRVVVTLDSQQLLRHIADDLPKYIGIRSRTVKGIQAGGG